MSDGSLKYKVTKPTDRKFVKAVLVKHDDGRFQAVDDNKKLYNLNQAAVTFFAGEAGNEASIIVPLDDRADYAAIETIIK
jgi:Ni,Fe-hydrogenase III component G